MTGALAVWVKTPELSPVKTRLAASIGAPAATEFFRLSVRAVEAVVRQPPARFTPHWAVAEAEGLGAWHGFPAVVQGPGGLGTRLSRVYDALLERHPWVLFIGADAPQITPELLDQAVRLVSAGHWVLGPAEDGGFYLFGGSRPLAREVWESVPYSTATTAQELAARLGSVQRLPPLFDVDTEAELRRLRAVMQNHPALLPAQRALLDWMEHRR